MKIVFIQPKACFFAEGHLWEPVNFGYLISFAKQFHPENEYVVRSAKFFNDEEILYECEDADLVAFTATSPQIYHAGELSKKIKGAIKLFGGVQPTINPEDSFKRGADIVVRGEGELAFKKILDNLPSALQQKVFCEPLIKDINSIPFPDRNSIQQKKYFDLTTQNDGVKIASINSARGCNHYCTFCTSHVIWGRKVRFRCPENIINELEELVDMGMQHLKFSDDTFTIDRQRVKEFCNLKIKKGLNVPWSCNARVTIDFDTLKNMKAAGCNELWFGVESGSQKILNILKKGISLEQIKNAFKNSKKLGIKTRGYFMIGNDDETENDVKLTENFIEELNPDIVGISINTPFPGSLRYSGKFNDVDWRKVDLYDEIDGVGRKVWGNEHITGEKLKEIQQNLLRKFSDKLVMRFRQKQYDMTVKE